MRTNELKTTLVAFALFGVSLLVCAGPRVAPHFFAALMGNDAKILGELQNYAKYEISYDKSKTANYLIPEGSFNPGSALILPPIHYSYVIKCTNSDEQVLFQNSSQTLQRNLNRYLVIQTIPENCGSISINVIGPPRALRLAADDGYVLSGDQTRLEDLRWVLEFLTEGFPFLLAIIFISIVFLYQISGIRAGDFDKSGHANVALWISSVFFINQTGLFLRLSPFSISENISGKIGAGLGILSVLLWILTLVSITNRKASQSVVFRSPGYVFFIGLISTAAIIATPYHRFALIIFCASLGIFLIGHGAKKARMIGILLGICLLLDSGKIYGIELPFSSRTSWYFLCELLILDSVIRQFSYSRTQWLLHRFSHEIDSGTLNISDALDKFRLSVLAAFNFKIVNARVLVNERLLPVDLRAAVQLNVPIGKDKLVVIQLSNSLYFDLDLPAAKSGLATLTNELESRLPAIFLRVLDEQARKFDSIVDGIAAEFQGIDATQGTGLQQHLEKFSELSNTRVLFADYIPTSHQVKPRFVLNYPEKVRERFLEGYLSARPDNSFSPLSQGVHSERIYSCPDVDVLKPFLHENTVQFYEETKTLSCFAFNVSLRVNGDDIRALMYVESSEVRFDEHFKATIEKFRSSIDSYLRAIDLNDQLVKATSALSRFIPRAHVFALMSGAKVVEKDKGYLLMVDLKGSTKFSLKHGSDAWLRKVEMLQVSFRESVARHGMTLQTFSWDAAFITKTSLAPSKGIRETFEMLALELGYVIQNWANSDSELSAFWSKSDQKARFCLTFGDISRGLSIGTTETWTVTGESMAVIAKMESECKKLVGVFFTDDDPLEVGLRESYVDTGCNIRGVDRLILFKYKSWSEFISANDSISLFYKAA
jgi:hypothetical protein